MDEPVDLNGPDEDWIIEKVTGEIVVFRGHFVFNTIGVPLWFQTGTRVIFMTGILSAERKGYT